MDASQFKQIARHWLTGVGVVTATIEGRPFGMTVSALTPLSLKPAQFLICIDNNSETLAVIKECGAFCINCLAEEQRELATVFAKKGDGKFSGVAHRPGKLGMPILEGVVAHVECKVIETMAGGDHAIIIGLAEHGGASGGRPLAYYSAAFGGLK
jgi:flavin reductase (DIM6/NTAB) family NADH-FMN oxidoreductase RutF